MWSILGNVGGLVGLVVFLGAAVVYVRGSRDKGTIATLKENNEALTARVTLLEAEGLRMTTRITALERENASLLAQRPSADAIAQIGEDVDTMRVELHKHDIDTKALLTPRRPGR